MKQIPLTRGLVALVDDADYDWLMQWSWQYQPSRTPYARRSTHINGKPMNILMHRAILSAPDDVQVDHIDRNGLNNQRSNLRLASHAENMTNRKLQKNNSSGFRGVYWSDRSHCFIAYLRHDGRKFYCGRADTAEAAYQKRLKVAAELYGEFAPLDSPI